MVSNQLGSSKLFYRSALITNVKKKLFLNIIYFNGNQKLYSDKLNHVSIIKFTTF